MKKQLCLLSIAWVSFVSPALAQTKFYEVPYVEEVPNGVFAWKQSGLLKDQRETRFGPYDQKAAEQLILDATANRGVTKEASTPERLTAFRVAYDSRGVGIFIEAEEPLIRNLLDSVTDPASPGRNESMEVFLSPALSGAHYYQMIVNLFTTKTEYPDWASPSKDYRPLRDYAQTEVKPTKEGFGVSIFLPWEAMYEYIPREGGEWRFTIVRWMPFAKAGGVTWGGQVHETGKFGHLKLKAPTKEQLFNMARYAWFNFLARSKEATKFWNDEKVGDQEFYTQVLKPLIDQSTELGQSLGSPDEWAAASLEKIKPLEKDWLEFSYKVADLRKNYLLQKRFSQK